MPRVLVETYWDQAKAAIRVKPCSKQGIEVKNVQFPRDLRTAVGLTFMATLTDAGKFWRASNIVRMALDGKARGPDVSGYMPVTRLRQAMERAIIDAPKPTASKPKRYINLEDED